MRKFLRNNFYAILILLSLATDVQAQDPHFSQFSNVPMQVNPALTGIFNGTARISNSYRTQWSGLGKGYQTIHISAEAPVGREKNSNNYFGVGAMVMQDQAGTSGYRSTVIEGALSYTMGMNDQNESYFAFGMQVGLNQQSIDLTKATWDSQWNGDIFDPLLSSGESIQLQQFTWLDFNAGILYYFIPDENKNFSIGGSYSHIGSPNVSFYTNAETPLRSKITIHSSGEILLSKSYEAWIDPKILFMMQGNQMEILAGGHFKRKVQLKSRYTNYRKEAYFYVGGFYRYQDAVVISARFEFNTLGLGLSYDFNASSLSKVAGSSNAFEVTLSFIPHVKRGSRAGSSFLPKYF